jgi:integrase
MAKKTNCTINGKAYYRIRFKVGLTPEGKPKYENFYGSSKSEAEAMKHAFIKNGLNQGSMNHNELMHELLGVWFKVIKTPSISMNTHASYTNAIKNHINKSKLATMRLVDIKSIQVQEFLNSIESKAVLSQVLKVLNPFFRYCIKDGILTTNPMTTIEKPKFSESEETPQNYLEKNEFKNLVAACKDNMLLFMYVFIVGTGLRVSELCALNVKDVDLVKMRVHVYKSVVVGNNKGETERKINLEKTKTRKERYVPLSEELVAFIKRHETSEKVKHMSLGLKRTEESPFFTNTFCDRFKGTMLSDRWARMAHMFTTRHVSVHGLRHTFCTFLCSQSVPTVTAAKLMGHSNTRMVERIYAHMLQGDDEKAISKLSGFF